MVGKNPYLTQSLNSCYFWRRYWLNNPIKFIDPSGHYAICFQQGTNDASVTTALTQLCTQLAEAGFFGPSGIDGLRIVSSLDREQALAYLQELMELYPDEQLYLMGFSYGGAAAIEFAHLLNDFGGGTYKGTTVPDVGVRGLILIDAVRSYRDLLNYQLYEGLTDYSIPGNVDYAINLWAPETYAWAYVSENPFHFGAMLGLFPVITAGAVVLNPVDHGMQSISGAFNMPVAGTNHCSIGYASCPVQAMGSGVDLPFYVNQSDPPNPLTLALIKALMLTFE